MMYGDNSLETLLSNYGYSLELVPTYGADDAENLSNDQCGVEWNTTSGVFESTGSVSTDSNISSAPSISVNNSPIASDGDGSDISTFTPASGNDSGENLDIGNSSRMISPEFFSASCILSYLLLIGFNLFRLFGVLLSTFVLA